jgi:hypothetical protein
MLIQLQKTKHGSPHVDDEDVPESIRSTSAPLKKNDWDTDDNWFKRWDWVMDEMIWTFEQLSNWDNDSKFFDHTEVDKNEKDVLKQVSKIKCDQEGLVAHNARIANGLRLFGKYYRGLWD